MRFSAWLTRAHAAGRLVTGLFRRPSTDAQLNDEIEFHIERATERNIRSGMSPDAAHRAALLTFGGRSQWTEATRDAQRSQLLDDFLRDTHYGFAALRRSPGFAASAVITIALALAATTTVFSFINSVYFRPLAVPDGKRLVRIYGADRPEFDLQLGYGAYRVLRDRAHSFDAIAAHYSTAPLYLTAGDISGEVMGGVVSADYFRMLGIRPALGRFFTLDEDVVPDRDAVAVVGYALWQTRFGGDPRIIGKSVAINGRSFTIVGVAPGGFEGVVAGWMNELWIPTMMLHTGYRWCDAFQPSCAVTSIMTRLAPGVTLREAQAELSSLRLAMLAATDPADSIRRIATEPASGVPAWQQREYAHLSTLLSAIAIVLMLVACANLGGLLLARGIARHREIALRASLGARRGRIARQLLTESLTLGVAGGVLGVALSLWTSRALVAIFAADTEGYVHRLAVPIDGRVLTFAVASVFAAVLLFGLFPALRVSRVDIAEALKIGSGGVARSRARSVLVAGQVMLAVSLLVGAGLMTRSLGRLMSGDQFDPTYMAQLRLRPRLVGYTPEVAQPYLHKAIATIRAMPGVVAVAPVRGSIATQVTASAAVALPGVASPPGNAPRVDYLDVGPGYFATLRVPVLAGREFSERDLPNGPLVALVNETLARQLWRTVNVVGRPLSLDGKTFQVVGVVSDYRLHRSDEAPPASAYVAFWQNTFEQQVDARLAIRVDGDPGRALLPLRQALASVDPRVPVTETLTMTAQLSARFMEVRLGGAVLGLTAAIALFLSAVGLYGVVSFLVRQRAKEIGIRLAVGARPAEVVALLVRQGMRPIALGGALGVLVSLATAPLLSRWLFGVAPIDVATILFAVSLVAVVALIASWLPARRAARTDPALVFRCD